MWNMLVNHIFSYLYGVAYATKKFLTIFQTTVFVSCWFLYFTLWNGKIVSVLHLFFFMYLGLTSVPTNLTSINNLVWSYLDFLVKDELEHILSLSSLWSPVSFVSYLHKNHALSWKAFFYWALRGNCIATKFCVRWLTNASFYIGVWCHCQLATYSKLKPSKFAPPWIFKRHHRSTSPQS
jgi:hypothetical protein